MTVSCSDAIALQQDINKLEQWENTWQMKFNADKCFTIRITNSRNPIRVDYKIHDQHLNLVTTDIVFNVLYILFYIMYNIHIVKRFRAHCGFYAIENKLLLLLL